MPLDVGRARADATENVGLAIERMLGVPDFERFLRCLKQQIEMMSRKRASAPAPGATM